MLAGRSGHAESSAPQVLSPSKPAVPFSSCERDSRCKKHYQYGFSLSEAEQYEAALVSYQSAYARVPAPLLLLSIGRMQHKCRRPEQAVETYKKLLSNPLPPSDRVFEESAQRYLREAEVEIQGQHPPTPPPPTVDGTQPSKSPSGETTTPLYKKWWLWTAVGAAAAGIIIGASVGAYATRPLPVDAMHIQPFN